MSAEVPQPALDRELALSRVGGDIELLREIAVLFVNDCPRAMRDIREAVERRDAARLEHAAHSLKGSVANFGAQSAVAAALRMEQMGRAGNLDQAPETLCALEHALAAVCAELGML